MQRGLAHLMNGMCVVLVLVGFARADSTIRLHAEVSMWPGYTSGNLYTPYMEYSQDGIAIDARAALGLAWGSEQSVIIRVGGVVDAFLREPYGIAGGIEVQADVEAWPDWRVGGRIAGLVGDGDDFPAAGDGQVLVAGLRFRNRYRFVGIDGMFARNGDGVMRGHANGVLIGGGISGKPGALALAGIGGITAVLGLLVVAAMSGTH